MEQSQSNNQVGKVYYRPLNGPVPLVVVVFEVDLIFVLDGPRS